MKNKRLFIIINLLYILIPLLILVFPILFQYKFYFLTIFGLLIYFITRKSGISNEELGIKKDNIFSSILNNLPICIISIIIIILMRIIGLNKFTPNETIYFYLFYIFVSCPLQEFLYRGIFGCYDNGKNYFLLLSSFMYSFVHIIYKDIITIILTFIIGIIWFYLYRKDKNLFGVSLSHCIVGILTIFLGIID